MNRGHRTFMAGIHGLKHVEGFFAAALSDNDPVGPHTQSVFHQFALANFSFAFGTRWACFHSANVRELQLQLGGILDRDDAFLGGNEARKCIQHGSFAASRSAGNNQRNPADDCKAQHFRHHRAAARRSPQGDPSKTASWKIFGLIPAARLRRLALSQRSRGSRPAVARRQSAMTRQHGVRRPRRSFG